MICVSRMLRLRRVPLLPLFHSIAFQKLCLRARAFSISMGKSIADLELVQL